MVNLIWKDLLIQKWHIPLYIAIIAFYFWIDISSLAWLGFIVSISFIMNAFYYDEKDNINILLNSLPYMRKQIVSSKYIGAILFTALFAGLTIIGSFIVNGMELDFSWKDVLQTFGLVMAWLAVIFPFFYKFKQQYLLIGAVIFFIIIMLTFKIVIYFFNERFGGMIKWLVSLPDLQLYSSITFIILLLYSGSWLLSIRIYERKVF